MSDELTIPDAHRIIAECVGGEFHPDIDEIVVVKDHYNMRALDGLAALWPEGWGWEVARNYRANGPHGYSACAFRFPGNSDTGEYIYAGDYGAEFATELEARTILTAMVLKAKGTP